MKIIKKPLNTDFVKKWMNKGYNPIILSIINRRGKDSENELINLFSPIIENIPSPFLYSGIVKAFKRIDEAIIKKEKIIIFGDIDVDGATSTVILYDLLKSNKADVFWEIPVGNDPYGLNPEKIKGWIGKYSLCITVDCGITNVNEISFLKENNIDTIIIDHHKPHDILPDAYSIVNPKNEKDIKFDNLAACGVTFIFILGYYFYKSKFFDKDIALIYRENNIYKIDKYKNLILVNSLQIFDKNILNDFDLVFFYPDFENDKIDNLKYTGLKTINEIYNNKIFYNIENKKVKSKISLIHYLYNNIDNFKEINNKYLPFVLLGTIADIMPLTDDNRILTNLGFNIIKKNENNNLNSLFLGLGIDTNDLTTKDISYQICPLLNAPGRMGDATKVIDFFINNFNDETITDMIKINSERKSKGEKAYKLFADKIDDNKKNYNNNMLFFFSDNIDKGITGLTATKISKYSNCPAIVAAKDGDYYTGSMRGDTNQHLVEFLEKGSFLLDQFGGHKNAAGFRIHSDKINEFKEFLISNSEIFKTDNKEQTVSIDAEIPSRYLDYKLFESLKVFEPFGEENPNPIFFTPGLNIINYFWLGKEKKHIKLIMDTPNKPFTALLWERGQWFINFFNEDEKYDITYQIEQSKYNSVLSLQLIILDINKSNGI